MAENCQKFSYELIMMLTDGCATLPMPEAADIDLGQEPAAMAYAAGGETKVVYCESTLFNLPFLHLLKQIDDQ